MRKKNKEDCKEDCKYEVGELIRSGLLDALIDVDGRFMYIITEKYETLAGIVGVKKVEA